MNRFIDNNGVIKLNNLITLRLYTRLYKISEITLKPIFKYRIIIETKISPSTVKMFFPDTTGTIPIFITFDEFSNLESTNDFIENWLKRNEIKIKDFIDLFKYNKNV